jgi:hypothetical protein
MSADEQASTKDSGRDDPVVEEVRTIRRRLWEASGRNVRRFIERSRESAAKRRAAKPAPKRDAG